MQPQEMFGAALLGQRNNLSSEQQEQLARAMLGQEQQLPCPGGLFGQDFRRQGGLGSLQSQGLGLQQQFLGQQRALDQGLLAGRLGFETGLCQVSQPSSVDKPRWRIPWSDILSLIGVLAYSAAIWWWNAWMLARDIQAMRP